MSRVTSVSYGLADGMRSLECTSGTQPPAWTHDGKLWYATGAGVSVIDPRRIPTNTLIPPVRIEELVVDGNTLPAGNTNANTVLPAGTKNLEFRYTALSFRVPERVKFRYKLEGYDQNWVDAGTRRVAYYTNLFPHDYRFRVIAGNDDGVWNEHGAALPFNLRPFFYQTKFFYALCLLAAVGAGFGAQRLRVKRLKKLVETRTRELSKANQKLLEAQERITKLLEVQPQALENISVWSQSVAKDIAQVVGVGGIAIWIREGEGFRSWGESDTGPPVSGSGKKCAVGYCKFRPGSCYRQYRSDSRSIDGSRRKSGLGRNGDQPSPLADTELNEMILWALQKDLNQRPATIALWIVKMAPLLRKKASDQSGWRLNALQNELKVPADPITPTERL